MEILPHSTPHTLEEAVMNTQTRHYVPVQNIVTLADFGLVQAARPVLYRERELARKRKAREVARRERALTITCANGFKIRPIK
jgi:hypothetical protein